ncbi:hypothetical protein BS78_01G512400 [Paspalum vaginatum]|nr:hypothetical protein BS78_01G512400 [Paspalum vaginatum]
MATPPPPPPPSSWLVLHKPDVRVSADQGNGFSVSRASPPLLSHLTVSAATYPQALRVLAADLSAGLFLLPGARPGNPRGYTVLSAANTAVSHYVPGRDDSGPDPHPSSVAVIGRGTTGGFMVVGIECDMLDTTKVWLHCYSDATLRWAIKQLHNPMPCRATAFDHVIAHDGRVWWVRTGSDSDTGVSGLLSCDPFAQHPQMAFSTSPEIRGFCPRAGCFPVPRVARRCVQVAGGKLRWVQILCYHMEERWPSLQRAAAPTVLVLTLDHHTAEWRRAEDHHRLSLADVWASDAYIDSCLPTEEPALAFIDPTDPDVLYFSLSRYFFAVDMLTKKAVGNRHHHGMPNDDVPSSSLLPWVLPPALRLRLRLGPAAASPDHRQAADGQASGSGSGGVKIITP